MPERLWCLRAVGLPYPIVGPPRGVSGEALIGLRNCIGAVSGVTSVGDLVSGMSRRGPVDARSIRGRLAPRRTTAAVLAQLISLPPTSPADLPDQERADSNSIREIGRKPGETTRRQAWTPPEGRCKLSARVSGSRAPREGRRRKAAHKLPKRRPSDYSGIEVRPCRFGIAGAVRTFRRHGKYTGHAVTRSDRALRTAGGATALRTRRRADAGAAGDFSA